ncbi:MAG TPA: Gfo/Idh/MocA family oxidoreductase [Planctomycetota bacterium]|nr:Gfo/Idh/MocA family oxidoreductase [Planctomycetota bacterium]
MLTSQALGGPEKEAASDRLAVGHIGVGGMGSGQLRGTMNNRAATSVAVCDVDKERLSRAESTTGGKAKPYHDFRQLLERQDIDAVVIASPDHWHALHTIHACCAGKDAYVQKPMCVTVREGQAMVAAARRYHRVVQMGSQGRSQLAGRYSAQYVRNGYCGNVREVRCWHYPNPSRPPAPPEPVPPQLDYDFWLGPLAYFPYHPAHTHGSFRWLMCSGGGNIRDRGAHIFGIVCWAMNVDATGPVSIEATGDIPDGLYDIPTTMSVVYEFKDPDWTLHWDQPGEPQGFAGEARPFPYGVVFIGDKDRLVVGHCDGVRGDKKVFFEPGANQVELYKSNDHLANFFDCVKTRRRCIVDVAIGHRITSLCVLGNLAYRIGRKLRYDPVKEEFPGDDEANRMLHSPYREPWALL